MLDAELIVIFTLPPPWQTSSGARLTWAAVEQMALPEASELKYIQVVLLESHMKARYGNQYFFMHFTNSSHLIATASLYSITGASWLVVWGC